MKHRDRFCKQGMDMNLQFFAEGGGAAGGGAGGGSASGNAAGSEGGQTVIVENDPAAGEPEAGGVMSFDDFLKDPKNQAEFDRRVGKALETSRSKMQADIEAKIIAARTEAEKLAKMNAEQKAEYEKEKRDKE